MIVEGRELRVTNGDRVFYPSTGFTKSDVIAWYLAIADVMLPHLADRPLTLGRFPTGVEGRGFAQTECPGRPEWVRNVPLRLVNGDVKGFIVAEERATLAWLAQMGTVELHVFLGTASAIETPTAVVFDLDPSLPADVRTCAEVALMLREMLEERGLRAFVKTSGGVGLHVLVPVTGASYAQTRAFATTITRELVERRPELITDRMPRAGREGKVLVDVRQNAERLSLAAPYSLRAALRPSVSTPIEWDELAGDLSFTPERVLRLLEERPDPWREIHHVRQRLSE